MQSGTESLVTFLPHSLPFLCQSGTVVIQPAVATVQMQPTNSLPKEAEIPVDDEVEVDAETAAVTSEELEESDDQLETDKQSIYEHPLFPLMTRLFEKCEKATAAAGNGVSSESFDEDILAFVRQQENCGKPFFVDSPEIDGLMVRAIQVLRIHVLEIEKVGELCKDFCQRYITSLKTKLSSEQLLGEVGDCVGDCNGDDETYSQSSVTLQTDLLQQSVSVGTLGHGQVVSGGTVYQMVQTPHGLVAQPIQIQQPFVNSSPTISATSLLAPGTTTTITQLVSSPTSILGAVAGFDDDDDSQKKLKRGVLPKRATQVMKSWLFQHLAHPYPTEDEKRQIAAQTNLTLLQVNNWFINGRRRILQPMLDSSGASCSETKPKTTKVNTSSTKSAQRFWPENIANLQYQQTEKIDDSDSQMSSENTNNIETMVSELDDNAYCEGASQTIAVDKSSSYCGLATTSIDEPEHTNSTVASDALSLVATSIS